MTTCLGSAVHSLNCACFCERLEIRLCASFPFGFEDGMWDLTVLIPVHCPSIYLSNITVK